MKWHFWILPLLFLCPLSFSADGTTESVPRLQVRLIRASNEPSEKSDPRVKSLNAQLKADFGYKNYQQIFFADTQFIRNEKAMFQMPDDFSITITYKGRSKKGREFFVETEYKGKKFVGFYAVFPDKARPVLIRGPGSRDYQYRYIIAMSPG